MTDRRDPAEERLLFRLRIAAGVVVLMMLVLIVVSDVLGRFVSSDYRGGGELFFGTLVGALMLLIGLEGAVRLPGGRDKGS